MDKLKLTFPKYWIVGIDFKDNDIDINVIWEKPVICKRISNNGNIFYEFQHPYNEKYIKIPYESMVGKKQGPVDTKEYDGQLYFSLKKEGCEGFIAGCVLSGSCLFQTEYKDDYEINLSEHL